MPTAVSSTFFFRKAATCGNEVSAQTRPLFTQCCYMHLLYHTRPIYVNTANHFCMLHHLVHLTLREGGQLLVGGCSIPHQLGLVTMLTATICPSVTTSMTKAASRQSVIICISASHVEDQIIQLHYGRVRSS